MNALPEGMHGGTSVFGPVLCDKERSVTRTFQTEVAREAGPELLGFVRESQPRTLRGGVRGLNRQTDASEGELARLRQDSAAIHLATLSRGSRPERLRNETGPQSLRYARVIIEARQTEDSWLPQGTYPEGGFQ